MSNDLFNHVFSKLVLGKISLEIAEIYQDWRCDSNLTNFRTFKVAVMSLKLDIRLHAHPVGTNAWLGTKVIFKLIWLAHAFAHSIISGLNDGTATLSKIYNWRTRLKAKRSYYEFNNLFHLSLFSQMSRCAMLWFSRFFAISPYPLLLSQHLAVSSL